MADRSFLFWPFLDPRHLDVHDCVEAWAATSGESLNSGPGTATAATVRRLAAEMDTAGFLATALCGRDGSPRGPLDTRSLCICREVLARHAGLADFVFAMQGLGTAPIRLFGTDDQKVRWLPSLAQGKSIPALALSEAAVSSDVSTLATQARPDGDYWRLDGVKTWISNAGIADLYVVFARTGDAIARKGLTAFLIPADAPGLSVTKTVDGLIALHPIGTVILEDVKVPSTGMLGAPGDGLAIASAILDIFRPGVGAAALGFARRALDEAAMLERGHQLSSRSLSDFRLTHAKLADMALAIDAAALLVYRAAWTRDIRGASVARESGMARRFAIDSAQKVIDDAMEIVAGLGPKHAHTIERLCRERRALRNYERASDVLESAIAVPDLAEAEADSYGVPIRITSSAVSGHPVPDHA
jgi:acyl-CoA dehydrogenase